MGAHLMGYIDLNRWPWRFCDRSRCHLEGIIIVIAAILLIYPFSLLSGSGKKDRNIVERHKRLKKALDDIDKPS